MLCLSVITEPGREAPNKAKWIKCNFLVLTVQPGFRRAKPDYVASVQARHLDCANKTAAGEICGGGAHSSRDSSDDNSGSGSNSNRESDRTYLAKTNEETP